MKANELMIGDWVLYNETYQQILEISGIDDEVYLEADELVHQSEIQSIPLTPEILEKNGFHKEWDEDIMLMSCDTIIVEIGDNYKLYKDGKMYLRGVLAPLYYVHELQHAMRLCGIEKEIVI